MIHQVQIGDGAACLMREPTLAEAQEFDAAAEDESRSIEVGGMIAHALIVDSTGNMDLFLVKIEGKDN